jgi:hypothetical protein
MQNKTCNDKLFKSSNQGLQAQASRLYTAIIKSPGVADKNAQNKCAQWQTQSIIVISETRRKYKPPTQW